MRTAGSIIVLIAMLLGNGALTIDLISSFITPGKSVLTSWGFLGLAYMIGLANFILAIVGFFKSVGIGLFVLSLLLVIVCLTGDLQFSVVYSVIAIFGSILSIVGARSKKQKLESSNSSFTSVSNEGNVDDLWYYRIEESNHGPFSVTTLKELYKNGEVQDNTTVWTKAERAQFLKDSPVFPRLQTNGEKE